MASLRFDAKTNARRLGYNFHGHQLPIYYTALNNCIDVTSYAFCFSIIARNSRQAIQDNSIEATLFCKLFVEGDLSSFS